MKLEVELPDDLYDELMSRLVEEGVEPSEYVRRLIEEDMEVWRESREEEIEDLLDLSGALIPLYEGDLGKCIRALKSKLRELEESELEDERIARRAELVEELLEIVRACARGSITYEECLKACANVLTSEDRRFVLAKLEELRRKKSSAPSGKVSLATDGVLIKGVYFPAEVEEYEEEGGLKREYFVQDVPLSLVYDLKFRDLPPGVTLMIADEFVEVSRTEDSCYAWKEAYFYRKYWLPPISLDDYVSAMVAYLERMGHSVYVDVDDGHYSVQVTVEFDPETSIGEAVEKIKDIVLEAEGFADELTKKVDEAVDRIFAEAGIERRRWGD